MQDKLPEHDSYDPSYFSHLFEVEDHHFWFRARNRVITAAVARVKAHLAPGYRFLEVGCGTGNVLRALEQTCKGAW
jgi:ubiquinone/menaquinone biosynthesis C-methylase UbiE